ncbi:protein-S-isoprenylcysteine O-methyltransferase Ste14 [Hoeflea marina]|uniref:Protein-S-isoprenylcysteine O-methyltransferase Ste14 n=1 Tax=Hoeflea marina TaxID=274592 RepID=A0A317PQ83_9HYPH|nr:isoprenylcysteine carboxylmethyltransferase family protein [Hoeflea marina]PWW03648.1 protein-S-isoprenylcysteine O-methyltransferase Ste14 [Hoeflea marina]
MNVYRARPNSIPWPPLLLVLFGAAAIAAFAALPLPLVFHLSRLLGAVLILAGLAVDFWAMRSLQQAHTTILPHRGSNHLVTEGPFRFSRNPIYVANLLLLAGIGLATGNGWFIVVMPFDALAMHYLAVLREERHLLAQFGYRYENYCRKVRRWI